MNTCQISVVVPAHNEAGTLVSLVQSLHSLLQRTGQTNEIIIVDDGSSDATRQILEDITVPIVSVRNRVNRGKGYALRRGIARASGDVIAYIDADMSISPLYLLDMMQMIANGHDIVMASRFHQQGRISDTDSRLRTFASKLFVLSRSLVLDMARFKDTQCGLKIFTSAVKDNVISHCRINGYGFDSEFIFLANHKNFQIAELPIDLITTGKDKRYGYWLWQGAIIFRDLLRIRLNWWLKRYD